MGRHGHKEVEETFYFFEGAPTLLVNETPQRVREGMCSASNPASATTS